MVGISALRVKNTERLLWWASVLQGLKHREATIGDIEALRTTIIVLNLFYQPNKSLLIEIKLMFQHQYLQMFGYKLNKSE